MSSNEIRFEWYIMWQYYHGLGLTPTIKSQRLAIFTKRHFLHSVQSY